MSERTTLQVRMDLELAETFRTISKENKLPIESLLTNMLKISAKALIQDNHKLKPILSEYVRK